MTGFHMFKLVWIFQRRKFVPILTTFIYAVFAEIMWRFMLRATLRKLRRHVKLWNKIKIPVELNTKGLAFVTVSLRKEEKDFIEGQKKTLSDLRGEE